MFVMPAGVTLPKIGIFWLMDILTFRTCKGLAEDLPIASCPRTRTAAAGVNACTALGGECVVVRDGFYPLAYSLALAGLMMGLIFQRILPRLEALPTEVWRVNLKKTR